MTDYCVDYLFEIHHRLLHATIQPWVIEGEAILKVRTSAHAYLSEWCDQRGRKYHSSIHIRYFHSMENAILYIFLRGCAVGIFKHAKWDSLGETNIKRLMQAIESDK